MRNSLYWDDFSRRIEETVQCLKSNQVVPVRRVACFVTDKCNFRCSYCNSAHKYRVMEESVFDGIVKKYGDSAIIHITGGEPSTVKWLYPYLIKNGNNYRFHLNTNAFIEPPAKYVKRLKVSLDSSDQMYWNALVGKDAFSTVVSNIKKAIPDTVVSITCTLTRENYKTACDFIDFSNKEFVGLYALFFSIYKGTNSRFVFTEDDVNEFFNEVLPKMGEKLDKESLALLTETLDEKRRLVAGVRFPQNADNSPCYLSMSERVFGPDGIECNCSHLYRDGIKQIEPKKHEKCLYGCNRRLVAFNESVEKQMEG